MASTKSKPAKKPTKATNRNGRVIAAVPPGEIMTLAETAAWMQSTGEVIAKMAVDGTIPAKRVGHGEWRFSRSAILAWLATPAPPERGSKEAIESIIGTWPPDESERDYMRTLEEIRGRSMFEGLI